MATKNASRRRSLIFAVSGPSGSGVTTLTRNLLEQENITDPGSIELSVSVTTRARRSPEIDGVHYHFLTRRRFEAMRDGGELLEWTEVRRAFYGSPREPVERAITAGRDVIFDIEWRGVRQLHEKLRGDVVSVLILPPSIPELRRRLDLASEYRPDEIDLIIATASESAEHWEEYDYVIVNDDLDRAFFELSGILHTERLKRTRATNLPNLAQERGWQKMVPPALPDQEAGAHFVIREDGIIDFAPPKTIDNHGNNVQRLKALHPLLRDAAASLVGLISPNQHPDLQRAAVRYKLLVDQDLASISVAELYGEGIRLEAFAAASKRNIEERIAPALEDATYASLEAVIELHGLFILSTREGVDILAASERYRGSPADESEVRSAAIEIAEELKKSPDIATPDVAHFIKEVAEGISSAAPSGRSTHFGITSIRNVSVVVFGGAAIGYIAQTLGPQLGPPFALLAADSLRRSRPFGRTLDLGVTVWDKLASATSKDLENLRLAGFQRYRDFVLRNEAAFQRLAGERKSFAWLHRHIEWLKLRPTL